MGYSVENSLMAKGLESWLSSNFSHFSLPGAVRLTQSLLSHMLEALQSRQPLGMISLAALCIILVLELLDQFENLDIDDFEDYLEIDLDLDIGEIEGLELDPELEGELWNNIQDILGLLNRLEDLQI